MLRSPGSQVGFSPYVLVSSQPGVEKKKTNNEMAGGLAKNEKEKEG